MQFSSSRGLCQTRSRPVPQLQPPTSARPSARPPYVPPPPTPPRQPGTSLADVLQSFMEESNIRWGEILAATLIVLCSVGLVISLRNTLKEHSVFPGDSVHALHRRVSRRGTVHAAALEPAGGQPRDSDHLAAAGAADVLRAPSVLQQSAAGHRSAVPRWLLAAGIGIFTWVCYSASRELVGDGAWPLTIGVLGLVSGAGADSARSTWPAAMSGD